MTAPARCRCWDDPSPPPGARCKLCGRIAPGEPPHTCHARGCRVPVRPTLLMCPQHWRRVPRSIQQAVYKHYRSGQCDDKRPSREWHEAASAAIGYVAILERTGSITVAEALALRAYGYSTSSDPFGELQIKKAKG